MRAVIFGADKLGIDFYLEIKRYEEIVAFIDNDIEKQGKEILGIKILAAHELVNIKIDKIYIASSNYYNEIKYQMVKLGIDQCKIKYVPKVIDSLSIITKEVMDDLYQFRMTCRKDEYEAKWEKIKQKYNQIKVYELIVDAIGEFIPRLFMIENTCQEDSTLKVFIPGTKVDDGGRICNRYLLDMIRRKIYLVQEKDVDLWAYVLTVHIEDVDVSEFKKFSVRSSFPTYEIAANNGFNWFTNTEIEIGKGFLEQICLSKPFVCIAARTSDYNKKTIGHDFFYDYRNMDFSDYCITIKYLQEQDIVSVRMGRMVNPMETIDNCIDYAGLYADDFLDLYLASKCEFMISNSSGIVYLATLFSKPVLVVDNLFTSFGYGGTPYTNRDLYIPKKYYNVRKGRYLTLREMMAVEEQCLISGDKYEKMGIKFINNTPEEIAMATQEMVERLANIWQDSAEDKKNYEKYIEIYHEMEKNAEKNHNNWLGGPIPHRIATTYLRNNLYLLN